MTGDAVFDRTKRYRYHLWRAWDASRPAVVFVMLNPSTADEKVLDPTMRRCLGFANHWGYGRIDVLNLFALRTPSPRVLLRADAPVGKDNDQYIRDVCGGSNQIVLAWGNHGGCRGRDLDVVKMIGRERPLLCFGRTLLRYPCHPLYLSRSATLQRYQPLAADQAES